MAKIGYSRFIRMRESRRSFYNDYATQLPRAYELAGDYDAALKYYGLVEDGYCRNLFRPILIFRARIAYKKGEFEESFRNYCSYFQDFPRQERGVAYTDAEGKDNYLREHLSIRRVITGEKSPDVKRLSPFTEFSNFASFMEGEFEKLGRPKEFEEAMVEVRSIDLNRDKIDEIEQAEWERWGDGRNPTILEEREILRKERDQAKAPSA
ncbi:MAG: hypothetical protein IJM30_09740 [Thermoguttaceae bacterium]|nr:hypothetical protein [Thermoguttaceae bacterium]